MQASGHSVLPSPSSVVEFIPIGDLSVHNGRLIKCLLYALQHCRRPRRSRPTYLRSFNSRSIFSVSSPIVSMSLTKSFDVAASRAIIIIIIKVLNTSCCNKQVSKTCTTSENRVCVPESDKCRSRLKFSNKALL
jgi:hypothetical protein